MPWWDKLVSGLAGTPRTDATESATSPPAAAAKDPEPSPPHGCASDRLAGVAPTHGAGPSNVGDEEWSEPPDSPGASGRASGGAESGCDGEEGEGEAGGGGKSEAAEAGAAPSTGDSAAVDGGELGEEGAVSAREQVLLNASDELECLFQRLGADHFSALECVCSAWRTAIRAARLLCHQSLLFPNEAHPLPRTPGGLQSPTAVAVLPAGELAVTDTGNDLLRFIDAASGATRLVVGRRRAFLSSKLPPATPHVEAELESPMGVVADVRGEHVFVADTLGHRLVKLRVSDGAELASIGAHGTGPGQMIFPQGVAVAHAPAELHGAGTAGELVYICDTENDRLAVFRASTLELAFLIGGSAAGVNDGWLKVGPTELRRPRAITAHVGPHGPRVYVAEYETHRISALGLDGSRLYTIGGKNTALGRFHSPFGLAVFDGRLVVAEGCNSDGRPSDEARRADWQRDQKRLRVLAIDEGNGVYSGSSARVVQVQVLHPREPNVEPRSLSATDQYLYMADFKGNTIHVFSIFGMR